MISYRAVTRLHRSLFSRGILVFTVSMLLFAMLVPTRVFADPNCTPDSTDSSSSTTSTTQGLTQCQKDLYTSGVLTFDQNDGSQSCSAPGDDSLVGNDKVSQIMNY